jgi:cation transport ATPase
LDENRPAAPQRPVELTTWGIVYMLLGWLSLVATVLGGAGESPYFLAGAATLLPLGLGFWFRWSWARWAGFLLFTSVLAWAGWQMIHNRLWFLSIALLLTSVETLICLRAWPRAAARLKANR